MAKRDFKGLANFGYYTMNVEQCSSFTEAVAMVNAFWDHVAVNLARHHCDALVTSQDSHLAPQNFPYDAVL